MRVCILMCALCTLVKLKKKDAIYLDLAGSFSYNTLKDLAAA